MILKRLILLLSLLLSLAPVSIFAQDTNNPPKVDHPVTVGHPPKPGQLGDPAPPLTVLEWLRGGPITIQPGTNIYAIIFCTLSRINDFGLTNLDMLQNLYRDKGLVVVAVSDDSPETLKDFITFKGTNINFAVAVDDYGRRTGNTYESTFQQWFMPRAFLIGKDARVMWYGHPLRHGMGQAVDDILSGRFDLAQAKKQLVARDQLESYLLLARQGDPRMEQAGQVLLAIRTNDAPGLCGFAFQIASDPYVQTRDIKIANAALDRAEQISTTNNLDIAETRAILLFQSGQESEGLAKARAALAVAKDDVDKREIAQCIQAMEARMAEEKAASTNAPAGKP